MTTAHDEQVIARAHDELVRAARDLGVEIAAWLNIEGEDARARVARRRGEFERALLDYAHAMERRYDP